MVAEVPLSMARVHPEMIKPSSLIKIWRGQTEMFPFYPPSVLQIWREHRERYVFAKNMGSGLTLDVASGTGYGKQAMSLSGDKYIGLDLDFEANRQSIEVNKGAVEVINGNCLRLPFSSGVFERVVSFETIEHIPLNRVLDFLAELKRVALDKALIFISTPNREVFSPGKSIEDKPICEHHDYEFNPNEFSKILEEVFKEVELFGQGCSTEKDVENPSSGKARIKRIRNLINGSSFSIYPIEECENGDKPRFIIAKCKA